MSKRVNALKNHVNNPYAIKRTSDEMRLSMLFDMYLTDLIEIAAHRFEWTNLPTEIDPRFIEMQLIYKGYVLFYHDDNYDRFLAVDGAMSGVNQFNNPISFTTVGAGGYKSKTLDSTNCVPIFANYARRETINKLTLFAQRFADLDRTTEIAALNLRSPKVVTVEQSQLHTFTNLMRKIRAGAEAVFGTRSLATNLDGIQVLDLEQDPRHLEALEVTFAREWSKCMTLLGINNVNAEKKERMVTDEANANNEQVLASRNVGLATRLQACELINRIFGLDIGVRYIGNDQQVPMVSMANMIMQPGGVQGA